MHISYCMGEGRKQGKNLVVVLEYPFGNTLFESWKIRLVISFQKQRLEERREAYILGLFIQGRGERGSKQREGIGFPPLFFSSS